MGQVRTIQSRQKRREASILASTKAPGPFFRRLFARIRGRNCPAEVGHEDAIGYEAADAWRHIVAAEIDTPLPGAAPKGKK